MLIERNRDGQRHQSHDSNNRNKEAKTAKNDTEIFSRTE